MKIAARIVGVPGKQIPDSAKHIRLHRPCLAPTSEGDLQMREWHKPTIEETESGMEVTSYLPAELDRT